MNKEESYFFTELSGNIRPDTSRCVIYFHGHQSNLLAIQPFVCKSISSFSSGNTIAYQGTWNNDKSLEIKHPVTLPNASDDPFRALVSINSKYLFWSVDMITSWQIV